MTNTLRSTIKDRFLKWLARSSLRKIRKSALKILGFLALAFTLIAPSFALGVVVDALQWDGFRVPISLGLVAVALALYRLKDRRAASVECIEEIPTVELIDHLVTVGTFKRDEVKRKFGVPQYRVEALTQHLKRVGVLTHGANNMSVLNPAYSRQDIASILAGVTSARQMQPLMRRAGNGLTREPSAGEIRARAEVPNPLPLAPGFTFTELADTSHAPDVRGVCNLVGNRMCDRAIAA